MNNDQRLPQWERKNWGWVMHLFCNDQASSSILKLIPGERCSRHYHEHRANLFVVVEGCVVVEVWPNGLDGESVLHRLVGPASVAVPSGVWHRFRVLNTSLMVEFYWADGTVRADDIQRADVGGPDPVEDIMRDLRERNGRA